MKFAVIYGRVSSKDQEREGFSIPAQLRFLREYASRNDLQILKEFVDVETAKTTGRKKFGEMLAFFQKNRACRALIVEKTDRLYRNFKDSVTLEDLDVEIHLPKEGQIISKDSKSQAKLIHGIQLVIARNYIENLKEEVKKGMREKAEQGIYPSRPPLGYQNNKLEHTIELNPHKVPVVKSMFFLYASGRLSLSELRIELKRMHGANLAKGYLERLLKNPFYVGLFKWDGRMFRGSHKPLVSQELFDEVQRVFKSKNKPHYGTHNFAYRGILTCAYDNCKVTAEIKKEKYIYYRCTQFRGKCELPYFREEILGDRLGTILKDIHVPDDILAQLQESLLHDRERQEAIRDDQERGLDLRLNQVRRRLDQAYQDKLDGKISEEFWSRKTSEWQLEENQILASKASLGSFQPQRILEASRILELANKAYFLYVKQSPEEKAKLLKMVLSNCAIDAVSVYPVYKKPFDLIFRKAKTEEWRALRDSNSRPSGS
jgi:site-specific DNA recombinase